MEAFDEDDDDDDEDDDYDEDDQSAMCVLALTVNLSANISTELKSSRHLLSIRVCDGVGGGGQLSCVIVTSAHGSLLWVSVHFPHTRLNPASKNVETAAAPDAAAAQEEP